MNDIMPTYFVSHGGGPWPWVKDYMPPSFNMDALEASLAAMPGEIGAEPKAILMVSGHWDERLPTIQTSPNPPMYYDFGGFPEFAYHIQYPSPGSPEVAARVGELLAAAGIEYATDTHRGYDHGMYAPMYAMYPEANMPTLQLSLRSDFDPEVHLAIGRALAPLRAEGVLIVGSGFSFHNLGYFVHPGGGPASHTFDTWLIDAVTRPRGSERSALLANWASAPAARLAHPREDHLIPLLVAAGAGEQEQARVVYHEDDFAGMGIASTSFAFGL
jgi:aromatic ring-opening dioxygenase catalytic subunit (LigB family)